MSLKQQEKWLEFSTTSIQVSFVLCQESFTCTAKLGGIQLDDFIYAHKDPEIAHFIKSAGANEQMSDLITVRLDKVNPPHPQYRRVDVDIDVVLGVLTINFKPDTLIKLLAFLNTKEREAEQDVGGDQ